MKSIIRKLVQSEKLFNNTKDEKFLVEPLKPQKESYKQEIASIINEFHFIFVSSKNYKFSLWYRLFAYLLLIIAFIFVINPVIKLTSDLINVNFSYLYRVNTFWSYIIATICMFIYAVIYVEHYWKIEKQVFQKYKCFLDEDYYDLIDSFKYRKKIKSIIQKEWLINKFNSDDFLEIAEEISKWNKLKHEYRSVKVFNFQNLTRIIANKESINRIIALLIACFSILSLFVSKTISADTVFNHLYHNFISLFIIFSQLGISLFILGYEIYYFSDDIVVFIDDVLNDYFVNSDDSTTDFRVNRLIQILLRYHSIEVYKINDD